MTDDTSKSTDVLKDVYDAGRSEDPDAQLQLLGKDLVNKLFLLYRTGKVHTAENEATKRAVRSLIEIVEQLTAIASSLSLTSVGDSFYLNKVMLRVDFGAFENFRFLSQLFLQWEVSGLTFNGTPEDTECFELLRIMLVNNLSSATFATILVLPLSELEESEKRMISKETLSDPDYLIRLYMKSIMMFENVVSSLQAGDASPLNHLQRTMHEFIDAMGEERRSLLALATIRLSEKELASHSVNVTLLSLLLGRMIGLDKNQLSDLGVSALLHDLGKVEISTELLQKKSTLTADDRATLKKTNALTLRQLIRLKGFNEAALRRMLVAYEHTLDIAGKETKGTLSVLSRIVALAHCYDAMTTNRNYRDALLPPEALKLMQKETLSKFDPTLFSLFAGMLSAYPPGLLVLLNSKEIGIVIDSADTRSSPDRPILVPLYDANGKRIREEEVDLSKDRKNRTIVKSLDAAKYRVNPLRYLFPRTD